MPRGALVGFTSRNAGGNWILGWWSSWCQWSATPSLSRGTGISGPSACTPQPNKQAHPQDTASRSKRRWAGEVGVGLHVLIMGWTPCLW